MGFFKDFKDDFSQAVNELVPGEDDMDVLATDEELVVNTLEDEVDVESELVKLDGLLEQVASKNSALNKEAEKAAAKFEEKKEEKKDNKKEEKKADKKEEKKEEVKVEEPKVEAPVETVLTDILPVEEDNDTMTKVQEEKVMTDNANQFVKEEKVISDEVSVITSGTIIKGDIISNGSLDIQGEVQGNVGCNGKLVVTGTVTGNSESSEFFADSAKIEGEVVSTGTVKIGLGSVVIGNVTSTSAVIAGAIKGDIDVQGPVVVDTSAVVMGNIKSRSVQINNGAVIEGFCSQCYSDVDVKSLFESKEGK